MLLVNVPIGAVAVALAPRLLPASPAEPGTRRFDVAGAVSVTAGLALLVYALVDANDAGWWSAQTLLLGAAAVLLLAAFGAIEAGSHHPLVPLPIFRNRPLRSADLVTVLTTGALFPMFFLTLYTQDVLGYRPVRAGLAQLPVAVTIATSATLTPRLMLRFGYKAPLVAGLAVVAHWPFLHDPGRRIRDDLDIAEYTAAGNPPMIPHTLVLAPGLQSTGSTTATGTGVARRWRTRTGTCGRSPSRSASTSTWGHARYEARGSGASAVASTPMRRASRTRSPRWASADRPSLGRRPGPSGGTARPARPARGRHTACGPRRPVPGWHRRAPARTQPPPGRTPSAWRPGPAR